MSDSAVVAMFVAVAVLSLVEIFIGFRVAANPRPDRPAWLGWVMVGCGVALCAFAIVMAVTF